MDVDMERGIVYGTDTVGQEGFVVAKDFLGSRRLYPVSREYTRCRLSRDGRRLLLSMRDMGKPRRAKCLILAAPARYANE